MDCIFIKWEEEVEEEERCWDVSISADRQQEEFELPRERARGRQAEQTAVAPPSI